MSFIFYTAEDLKQRTRWRWGEEKFGEKAQTVGSWEELRDCAAPYVLLGIPEDIGVRANYGKPGASKAWEACLQSLCNIQHNKYIDAEQIVVLGEVNVGAEMREAQALTEDDPFFPTKIGSLVKEVDHKVTEAISQIVKLNKIPIVIGGGHNNSYGNLKGTSQAFHKPIHCINLDAHTDFRSLEHRHSGNGFSYAMEEGFLENYFIFGMHRNYTSQSILERMDALSEKVAYSMFEALSIIEEEAFDKSLLRAKKHACHGTFGLELDMDAIAGMGSSAMTPSGITLEEARRFVRFFSKHKHCSYIHICEGSPAAELFPNQVGKALAYLVSDIISK